MHDIKQAFLIARQNFCGWRCHIRNVIFAAADTFICRHALYQPGDTLLAYPYQKKRVAGRSNYLCCFDYDYL